MSQESYTHTHLFILLQQYYYSSTPSAYQTYKESRFHILHRRFPKPQPPPKSQWPKWGLGPTRYGQVTAPDDVTGLLLMQHLGTSAQVWARPNKPGFIYQRT